ncbi:MAG: enoyl-CoA hydratase/isomerase family protein, partial [bacterium]|nr:enoyl-CoA hydratase/isomerase family protein [bacterium]
LMSEYEFLQFQRTGGVATITLDREPLNVLHNPMMAEMNHLLDEVLGGDDLPAALVFRANHKAFCAGVDVADHTDDKVGEMIDRFHGIFRRLAATDVLTIAAVGRAALGGGCELACFCDIVLASDRAKFGQPEVQVGVLPPVAACFLPQQVGLKKAVELNVLGATIGAAEAKEIGLVNQVFPVETFDEQVGEYLGQIQKLSR